MKIHWFQIVSFGVSALFFGLMALTIYSACNRKSGSTGQDMATIHKQRYDTSINKLP